MVLDARPRIEYLLVHASICDRIDIMLNKEYSLSLKVIFTVVVIAFVAIFMGVLNIWFSSNVGITEMWT